MMHGSIVCVLLVITIGTVFSDDEASCAADEFINHERNLMNCLLKDLNPSVRPVKDPSDTVYITMTLFLVKMFALDEKKQMLTTNVWIHKIWNDPQLRWNPADYGDITELRIPVTDIWTPDVVMYNTAAEVNPPMLDKLAVVNNTGDVVWIPYLVLHSHCHMDFHDYPFDTQKCELWFGSWTYDQSKVNLTKHPHNSYTDMFLNDDKEWEMKSVHSRRQIISYTKDLKEFPAIVYTLTMQRQTSFQQAMMIGPAVLLCLLSCFMFFIPTQSGSRLQLGCCILLGILLLFILLDDHLPTEVTRMPVIGAYLFFVFLMTTFAMLLTIVVMNCVHRDGKSTKIPDIVRNLFLNKIGRLVLVKPEPYASLLYQQRGNNRHLPDGEDIMPIDRQLRADTEFSNETPLPKSPTLALEQVLNDIRRYLKLCAGKEKDCINRSEDAANSQTSHRELVVTEWLKVATVVDRLCFVIYVSIVLLATIVLLSH